MITIEIGVITECILLAVIIGLLVYLVLNEKRHHENLIAINELLVKLNDKMSKVKTALDNIQSDTNNIWLYYKSFKDALDKDKK